MCIEHARFTSAQFQTQPIGSGHLSWWLARRMQPGMVACSFPAKKICDALLSGKSVWIRGSPTLSTNMMIINTASILYLTTNLSIHAFISHVTTHPNQYYLSYKLPQNAEALNAFPAQSFCKQAQGLRLNGLENFSGEMSQGELPIGFLWGQKPVILHVASFSQVQKRLWWVRCQQ